ncbi:FHA domain-containing protein [Wenzhouxiangella sp. XN201]|uniref:sigma 54-interacting transcriptional regulator n=1 Tax=Wenzhouxiangella sp. XN201 TaxID=2710755 RepID=UPI0013CA2FAD|nr:sigma 54-interacting transcriptional regulator [Wenzhouxiangella sp. XN201]NEZ05167.1 FHA domain-containing protein [Wenzhouxiangella sp. XN201]
MQQAVLCMNLESGTRRFVIEGDECTIGTGADCDIVIEEISVSRRHACLKREPDGWLVQDLDSTNGTRINEQRIVGAEFFVTGDRLQFGNVRAEFRLEDAAEFEIAVGQPEPRAATALALTDIPPTLASDRLAQFFIAQLPELIARLRSLPPDTHAACIIDCLPKVIAGRWRLLRDDSIIVESGLGDADAGDQHRHCDGLWCIELAARGSIAPSAFEAVAGFALNLVQLTAQTTRRAKGKTHSNPSDQAPPQPVPPSGHPGLHSLYRQAARVADSDINVLIEGDSGTGKELFARFLHAAGGPERPLITLNCASMPADLLDAELFGIEKGVATGVTERAGKFEQAHGGVLFLDEIGDMQPATQARILRVLQEREVFRIGGDRPRPADVRVVSATNHDMNRLVEDGRFRLDLYHRIADWQVRLPSLTERHMDIANLAAHFLQGACQKSGIAFGGISRAALDRLKAYDWPGNVRELEREMKRCALFLEDGEALRSDHLQDRIRLAEQQEMPGTTTLKDSLEHAERTAIQQALASQGGNISNTARQLGIGRSTLYRRIQELGIVTE